MSDGQVLDGQAPVSGEGGQAPTQSEVFDAEYVKQLRAEAAKWRTEAQAAKVKVTEFEKAQMTEAEKLQAQAKAAQEAAEAAQAELRRARAEAAVARVAGKVGVDPNLVLRLVDVEYDAQGQPVNVDKAVEAVLATYPQLKPATVALGATNPGRTSKLTMDDVRKMTEAEINARWAEVEAVMSGKS